MNNIVLLGCLFSKLPGLFVDSPSAIVVIFYRVGKHSETILEPIRRT
jgi:hypothetical protein